MLISLLLFVACGKNDDGLEIKGTPIYVNSVSGNDSRDGKTKENAVKTLNRAKQVADRINGEVTVVLNGGTYNLESAWEESSNTDGLHFVSENSKAVISGTYDVSGENFQHFRDNIYSYQLPDKFLNDHKYPLITDLYVDGKPAELARNNSDLMIYAEKGKYNAKSSNVIYLQEDLLKSISSTTNKNLSFNLWVMIEWRFACLRLTGIDYTLSYTYNGTKCYGAYVNEQDWDIIKNYCVDWLYYSSLTQRYYYVNNHMSLLDSGNEFYYNQATGTIYYIPEAGAELENLKISIPVTEFLFKFKNCKNISFSNVDLFGTACNYAIENGYIAGQGGDVHTKSENFFLKNAAIYGENVKDFKINNSKISCTGNDAINLRGWVENVEVQNSSFINIGGTALRFGRRTSSWKKNSVGNQNIKIKNNLINNTGRKYNCDNAITVASVKGLEIKNNSILNSAYSAISIGWSWSSLGGSWYNIQQNGEYKDNYKFGRFVDTDEDDVLDNFTAISDNKTDIVNVSDAVVSYNYIYNFMTKMRDGGAIYTLGGNSTAKDTNYHNYIHHNYVVCTNSVSRGDGVPTVIYHDGASSHWYDYDNVISVEPNNPTRFTYVSFQSVGGEEYDCIYNGAQTKVMIGGSQVYNIRVDNTYYINPTSDENKTEALRKTIQKIQNDLVKKTTLNLMCQNDIIVSVQDVSSNSEKYINCKNIINKTGSSGTSRVEP